MKQLYASRRISWIKRTTGGGMTGVFECLVCHGEFTREISKEEIDDFQDCLFCPGVGELQSVIEEKQ